jgi:hypothetical protein
MRRRGWAEVGAPRVNAPRVLAVAVGLVGGAAVFLWAAGAARAGGWWQVGVAGVVWALHAVFVARLWMAGG